MDINQVRYAAAVAQYKNFSKAADALFVTQPTLSQQVRKLEEELGFPLFERTTRRVSVTPGGETFLASARPLLGAWDALMLEVEKLKSGPSCALRVGILPTFAHLNILDAIHQFQSQRPEVSVSLQIFQSRSLWEMLLRGQLDVIIANIFADQLEGPDPDVHISVISEDVIRVVLHRDDPLAQKGPLRLEDLNGKELIMLSRASSIRNHMDAAFRKEGVHPHMALECPTIHSMIDMLRAGRGAGFLSSKVAENYISDPVVSVPLVPDIKTMTAILFRKSNPKANVLEQLSDGIRQASSAP